MVILLLLGLFIAYLGYYCIKKGEGNVKNIGIGLLGISAFIIPGGVFIWRAGLGALIIAIAIISGIKYTKNEQNGTNAKRRVAEQQQIQQEYREAVHSQQEEEPWTIRYSTSPCPHCGHYKVRCAKWEDKYWSVAFWGVASSKIGKQYKCEHCGEMW